EALRAVDGLVAARLEGDLGLLAALRAGRREHLPTRAVVAATAPTGRVGVAATPAPALLLARAPALRAAAGLVHEPAALVELLLPGGERELLPAIAAGQGPVLKHLVSLLSCCVRPARWSPGATDRRLIGSRREGVPA